MSLEFLNQTLEDALRTVWNDLRLVDPKISMHKYVNMTPRAIAEAIDDIEEETRSHIMETSYGEWLYSDQYVRNRLLKEGLELLIEYIHEQTENETLVPGFTYYRGVKQFGDSITGRKCTYLGESFGMNWAPFKMKTAIAKAMEVLSHGTEDDFRSIYVEMADGVIDPFSEIVLEHLTESSDEALSQIEKYCDQRWDGGWPWETRAPHTLRIKIDEKREARMSSLLEMQKRFASLVATLKEGEMEQYEVIDMARNMMKQVDSMIGDLGKISSTGIEAVAGARSIMGDDAAMSLEQALQEPVQKSAQSLSTLKAAIQQALDSLETGSSSGPSNPVLGTPGDAMGDPANPEMADELADVSLDGDNGERPIKEL